MATVCPYCNIEVSESSIEAEDGCCPECGSVISATSSFLGESDDDDDLDFEELGEQDIFDDLEEDEDFDNADFGDDDFEELDEDFEELDFEEEEEFDDEER